MPTEALAAALAGEPETRPRYAIAMLAACPFPTAQGTQVAIRHLAGALSQAGHDVHLITYGYGEPLSRPLPFAVHRAARIDVGMRSGPRLGKPFADAALLAKAAQVARRHGCQIIHAHHSEGLAVGAALKLVTGLPLVYHAHTALGPELPTYYRARLARAAAARLGAAVDRVLPRAADATVVFDEAHADMHRAYGIPAARLHVIPLGLDAAELGSPRPATVARLRVELGPGPWVLYAGNPDHYQNLPLLWQALARAREREPTLRLLVATHHEPGAFGLGEPGSVAQAGIRFYRYQSLDELSALFSLADVGLCPRTLWTGAPVKILNYLRANLPVVACASAGRLLSPSAGRLVEADPDAFAQGMLDLVSCSAELKARGVARQAFAPFRVEGQVSRYEELYAAVVASRG